jgi:Hypervirulence associated proteins TUDOR domain
MTVVPDAGICDAKLVAAYEVSAMSANFKRGDLVEWNSEAGRVRGTIQKKVTREVIFKGYKRHASPADPQYIIKSTKTDHLAIHKGSALKKVRSRTNTKKKARS